MSLELGNSKGWKNFEAQDRKKANTLVKGK